MDMCPLKNFFFFFKLILGDFKFTDLAALYSRSVVNRKRLRNKCLVRYFPVLSVVRK